MNYMPPAMINLPSPAFSVLKGFLAHHGYECKIINWNISINELMSSFLRNFTFEPADPDILPLLPFLHAIAEEYNDTAAMQRIISHFQSRFPDCIMNTEITCEASISELKKKIFDMFDSGLKTMDTDNVILFGFSAKFYQWIPGMILAKKLKIDFPGIKIVIGGLNSREEATAIMEICSYFDFGILGEGEYQLLEMLKGLEHGDAGKFGSVPRLVYRTDNGLVSTTQPGKYIDFPDYIFPDYSDSVELPGKTADPDAYSLPLEASRGCYWNRCKFCSLSSGYKYRRRMPQGVVDEIEFMSQRYNINRFTFLDSDIVGPDISQFEILLDMIIDSSYKNKSIYDFTAEVVPHDLNSRVIEKLAVAGFSRIQVGYEAITDNLLKKIDKKTDFSDLILFLKFASKFGITAFGANIMKGIVGETEQDVQESIQNLAFLRFFLNSKQGRWFFRHNLNKFRLEHGSRFFKELNEEELNRWVYNPIAYFLPVSFIDNQNRFYFWGFYKNLENEIEWDNFDKINKFYEDTEFKYQVLESGGVHYYIEKMGRTLVNYIIFNETGYWEVLIESNGEVTSFEKIFARH
jgi:radical SAM superfamily enzyme YgiQ (UPF0313 family)